MLHINYDGLRADIDFSKSILNIGKSDTNENSITIDGVPEDTWRKFIMAKNRMDSGSYIRNPSVYTMLISSGVCTLKCPYCVTDLYDFIETDHDLEGYKKILGHFINNNTEYCLSFTRKEAFENLGFIKQIVDLNTDLNLVRQVKIFTNGIHLIKNKVIDTPYKYFLDSDHTFINFKVTISNMDVGHINIKRLDDLKNIIENSREVIRNKRNIIDFVILVDERKYQLDDFKGFFDLIEGEDNINVFIDHVDHGSSYVGEKDRDCNVMINKFLPMFDYALQKGINIVSNLEISPWSFNTMMLPEIFDIPKFLCNAGQASITIQNGKLLWNFDHITTMELDDFEDHIKNVKSIDNRLNAIDGMCQKSCGKKMDMACKDVILEEKCPIFKKMCLSCNQFFMCNDHCNFFKPSDDNCKCKEAYFFFSIMSFLHKYKKNPKCVSELDLLYRGFTEIFGNGKV